MRVLYHIRTAFFVHAIRVGAVYVTVVKELFVYTSRFAVYQAWEVATFCFLTIYKTNGPDFTLQNSPQLD